MTETYGRGCFELFDVFDRYGLLARMFRDHLIISTKWSGLILKPQVTKSKSLVFRLQLSELHINAQGYGFWPTPTVNGNNNRKGLSENSGDGLATSVKKYVGRHRGLLDVPDRDRFRESLPVQFHTVRVGFRKVVILEAYARPICSEGETSYAAKEVNVVHGTSI